MKNHIMKLNPVPFEMIRSGKKSIELRLYDEKRREVAEGDVITFINTEDESLTLSAKVLNIHIFDSFDELYKSLPLLKCGYTEENIHTASPKDMDCYYSEEKQKFFGVVGIEIEVL